MNDLLMNHAMGNVNLSNSSGNTGTTTGTTTGSPGISGAYQTAPQGSAQQKLDDPYLRA